MEFVTIEDRVDRLEALFGQFMTEMAVLNKRADERDRLADERHKAAEERNRQAEERNKLAEERNRQAEERNRAADERMSRLEHEMAVFKNEMAVFKDEMAVFRDEMAVFKDEMAVFRDEMRADRKEMNRQWGALSNKLGHIVEDIMGPNLPRLARDHFKVSSVDEFSIQVNRRNPQNRIQWGEFDAILVSPETVLLGEAKSTPSIQYAEAFAEKLKVFTTFFPQYADRQLLGIFASWSMPIDVENRLTELGIYCLQMGEDTMDLTNAERLEK